MYMKMYPVTNKSNAEFYIKQVQNDLQKKLEKIKKKHEEVNTLGHNVHKHEERRAVEEAEYEIEQIKSLVNLNFDDPSYELGDKTINPVPRLTFYKKTGRVEYVSEDQKLHNGTFTKNTSEEKILLYLANNSGNPFETNKLCSLLKTPKQGADSPDPKRRVNDKISAIRKKLSKGAVKTTPNGYMIECVVIQK